MTKKTNPVEEQAQRTRRKLARIEQNHYLAALARAEGFLHTPHVYVALPKGEKIDGQPSKT